MLQNQIKTIFNSAVSKVVDNIDQYTFSPEKDLKRHKKLPADKLISFLISEGSASTKLELLDFFNLSNNCVTNSALNQQRTRIFPAAFGAVKILAVKFQGRDLNLNDVLFHNHSQKARKDKFLLRFIVLLRLYTNICQLKNKKYQFDFL